MSAELSFLDLFLEASLLVKSVMLCLLAFSVISWAMIFQRRKVLKEARKRLTAFFSFIFFAIFKHGEIFDLFVSFMFQVQKLV